MRYVTYFVLLAFAACEPRLSAEGLWIAVTEEGGWDHLTIEITADSIFIFSPFGLPLKADYKLTNNTIQLGKSVQLFSNEPFNDCGELEIRIAGDTLFWDSPTSAKLIKSGYGSYVEHYANSQGLAIDLPTSDKFQVSDFNNYSHSDVFIGLDSDGATTLKLGHQVVKSYAELPRLLINRKDSTERPLVLRVFADKSIDIGPIQELQQSMRESGVSLVHYVAKSPGRLLKDLNQNPYSDSFYGNKLLVR